MRYIMGILCNIQQEAMKCKAKCKMYKEEHFEFEGSVSFLLAVRICAACEEKCLGTKVGLILSDQL
eukprot:3499457-Amphidinium_carterae.1